MPRDSRQFPSFSVRRGFASGRAAWGALAPHKRPVRSLGLRWPCAVRFFPLFSVFQGSPLNPLSGGFKGASCASLAGVFPLELFK